VSHYRAVPAAHQNKNDTQTTIHASTAIISEWQVLSTSFERRATRSAFIRHLRAASSFPVERAFTPNFLGRGLREGQFAND